jgi:hypothetical protein
VAFTKLANNQRLCNIVFAIAKSALAALLVMRDCQDYAPHIPENELAIMPSPLRAARHVQRRWDWVGRD